MAEKNQLEFEFFARLALLSPDDIYAGPIQHLLQLLEEDRRIERKPASYQPRYLGDYFSMWANTQPDGGLIVVGVTNDGEITGMTSQGVPRLNRLEATGSIYCQDARYECKRVPVVNCDGREDFVLVFRVFYHKTRLVKTASGEAFTRIGESKKKLSEEMVRELEIDKGQIDLELELAPFKYPQDFDMDLVREFADGWRSKREVPDKTVEQILTLSHLGEPGKDGFLPNIACALLFAADPTLHFPGCKIRFLRFDGEHEGTGSDWNAVKDVWIDSGPIPRQIFEADRILESQLREFSRLESDGQFYTAAEYPKEAWYEAIVNACVHRSYGLKNMNIFIKMFDDRLVVTSPGGFPPLVTPENIYETHAPRNPRLMNALFYLDFVKCAHEGSRRMRDRMLGMNLPGPEFRQNQDDVATVSVTLRNRIKARRVWIDSEVGDIVSAAMLGDLDEHDRRAINYVAERGSINVTQMQRLTGRSWAKAKKMLLRLVAKGILEHKIRILEDTTGRDSKAHFVLRSS